VTRDSALGARCHKALPVSDARRALEIISDRIGLFLSLALGGDSNSPYANSADANSLDANRPDPNRPGANAFSVSNSADANGLAAGPAAATRVDANSLAAGPAAANRRDANSLALLESGFMVTRPGAKAQGFHRDVAPGVVSCSSMAVSIQVISVVIVVLLLF